jgi:hypothetical protein
MVIKGTSINPPNISQEQQRKSIPDRNEKVEPGMPAEGVDCPILEQGRNTGMLNIGVAAHLIWIPGKLLIKNGMKGMGGLWIRGIPCRGIRTAP